MSILRNYDIFSIEERVHNLESGGAPGGSWDYSTTETDTHQKWIDGKTIYCKVITGTFNFRANTEITIMDDKGDIDKIIDFKALETNCGIASPLVYVSGTAIKGYFYAQMNSTTAIIFYTKTELTKTKRSKK